ncbi:MAG: lysophospholipid acyltransferase family protein [Candidatus Hydrogenedentes bacterium]|jgi:lysophospholipid acyltransferase (LPLAT)-like uncharacterized protein|nr:lysophospholipid acyltransferase family protein [Candidatus Hydrogenedentota bacterium]
MNSTSPTPPSSPTPRRFSLGQRIQLATLPWLFAKTSEWLFRSCKVEMRGGDLYEDTLNEQGRCLVAIWHESMVMACCHNRGRGYVGLASLSYDGEFAARVMHHWRIHAARGSSSRGGHDALSALVEAANTVPITGFTLDGPRGPRRVAKPGIAILAARTQLPIVPNAFVAERCWRLSSWDRHPIQKPFSRIICAYAPPVPPPPDDSPEAVESTRLEVETRLNGLHESLEAELAASETQPS